jgi:hypothetical protein
MLDRADIKVGRTYYSVTDLSRRAKITSIKGALVSYNILAKNGRGFVILSHCTVRLAVFSELYRLNRLPGRTAAVEPFTREELKLLALAVAVVREDTLTEEQREAVGGLAGKLGRMLG